MSDLALGRAPAPGNVDSNFRQELIPQEIFNIGDRNTPEDIAMVRNMGFIVDDNNDPALENIPDPPTTTTTEHSCTLQRTDSSRNELLEGQE